MRRNERYEMRTRRRTRPDTTTRETRRQAETREYGLLDETRQRAAERIDEHDETTRRANQKNSHETPHETNKRDERRDERESDIPRRQRMTQENELTKTAHASRPQTDTGKSNGSHSETGKTARETDRQIMPPTRRGISPPTPRTDIRCRRGRRRYGTTQIRIRENRQEDKPGERYARSRMPLPLPPA